MGPKIINKGFMLNISRKLYSLGIKLEESKKEEGRNKLNWIKMFLNKKEEFI